MTVNWFLLCWALTVDVDIWYKVVFIFVLILFLNISDAQLNYFLSHDCFVYHTSVFKCFICFPTSLQHKFIIIAIILFLLKCFLIWNLSFHFIVNFCFSSVLSDIFLSMLSLICPVSCVFMSYYDIKCPVMWCTLWSFLAPVL